jgi:hypothetical protein
MKKNCPWIPNRSWFVPSLFIAGALAPGAHAATIVQTANAANDTSFGNWNTALWGTPASSPTSGNAYVTAGGFYAATANNLGTTTTGRVRDNGTIFAGDSLTVEASTEVLLKGGNGSTSSANLILNGGSIRYSPNVASSTTLAGTLQVTSESYLGVAQTSNTTLTITSTVSGSALLHIAGGGNNPAGNPVMTISFAGDLSGFTGTFDLGGGTNNTGGATTAVARLDFGQDYNLSMVDFLMGGHGTNDQLNLDQDLTFGSFTFNTNSLSAGTYDAAELNSLFGNGSQFIDGGGSLTVVPEPGATVFGGLGMLALLRRRRHA